MMIPSITEELRREVALILNAPESYGLELNSDVSVKVAEIVEPLIGVPGSICARGGEPNWNKRSGRWREERSIVQNRL